MHSHGKTRYKRFMREVKQLKFREFARFKKNFIPNDGLLPTWAQRALIWVVDLL